MYCWYWFSTTLFLKYQYCLWQQWQNRNKPWTGADSFGPMLLLGRQKRRRWSSREREQETYTNGRHYRLCRFISQWSRTPLDGVYTKKLKKRFLRCFSTIEPPISLVGQRFHWHRCSWCCSGKVPSFMRPIVTSETCTDTVPSSHFISALVLWVSVLGPYWLYCWLNCQSLIVWSSSCDGPSLSSPQNLRLWQIKGQQKTGSVPFTDCMMDDFRSYSCRLFS